MYNDHVIYKQLIRILIGVGFYVAKIDPAKHTVEKKDKKRKCEPENIEKVEKKNEKKKRKKKEYLDSDSDDFVKKPIEQKKKENVTKKLLKNKEAEVEKQATSESDDVFKETPEIKKKKKNFKKKKTEIIESVSVENLRENTSENEDVGILDRPVYQHMLMDSQESLQNTIKS